MIMLLASGIVGWQIGLLSQQIGSLNSENKSLQTKVSDALYEKQILGQDALKLTEEKKQLESSASAARFSQINSAYLLYQDTLSKISRNKNLGLDTKDIEAQGSDWGSKFLAQQFDLLTQALTAASGTLDSRYQSYLASLPPPPAAPVSNPEGYSYQTVNTSRGTFGVNLIKLSLATYSVRTISANSADCTNNCPVKPLAQYISENGAYAGMNGTYLCPPDYSSCAGKVNSYDFPVYNSNLGKWLNQVALSWTSIGLATFNGKTAKFYKLNNQYSFAPVTAAISNFPVTLLGGNIVVTETEQTDYQKLKGIKGSIGSDGVNVYLALISGANVTDSAYVMQALGAKDALNIDGGGTSAMFISGSYKVGPGRLLPNAVVLVHN